MNAAMRRYIRTVHVYNCGEWRCSPEVICYGIVFLSKPSIRSVTHISLQYIALPKRGSGSDWWKRAARIVVCHAWSCERNDYFKHCCSWVEERISRDSPRPLLITRQERQLSSQNLPHCDYWPIRFQNEINITKVIVCRVV